MADIRVKICGLTRPQDVDALVQAGAAYAGFNFFPKSPRYVTPVQARELALDCPPGLAKVALVVNPDDALLDEITAIVPLDFIQLHGQETPERVAEVRARYGLPVIKAVGLSSEDDLPKIDAFMAVADQLLIDAKAPKGAKLPGGNGLPFDWRLIAGRRWPKPWLLAGGLTADNVAEAIAMTGAVQVDLASAVESAPGVKDPAKIAAFITAAQADPVPRF
ncbi:phosphoribosylanthranilate isomerase [Sagittula sp. NFXS13]|uniref:N-(5'-phosphoribosyl)anthranilate isomerase n=1 Tax=Sagittula marina TaxID=943940 RepID=A0A7W6GSZ3_9RHOB|nr:phosphoribosylanthranilate isomerase [Sagittula marina]MBB3986941.1 phosphoribosylanthranilate isomerase [Sagittula marina]